MARYLNIDEYWVKSVMRGNRESRIDAYGSDIRDKSEYYITKLMEITLKTHIVPVNGHYKSICMICNIVT